MKPNPSDPNLSILIDGSSYLFRAYHALPPLETSSGHPTGAIKGVINMIRKLQSDFPLAKHVVVFDAKGKTFRNDLYPEYKANRPPMPDDLRCQIAPIHDIIRAMGLPLLVIEGVEADDVIGTLARQGSEMGQPVLISTGDKDMAQLVTPHVTLINTMTEKLMDEEGVVEKFGVRADQIIDYLALMGDTVDNIPGVPKCGPKTAAKWLKEYESMDNLLDHADKIGGKIGESLRATAEKLPLSFELATIKTDVELEHPLSQIEETEVDGEALRTLFTTYEFKSWLSALDENAETQEGTPPPQEAGDYVTILESQELDRWLKKIQEASITAFDTETTSLNYMQAELVGISLATEVGEAAYIPLAHDYPGAPDQLDRDTVLAKLKPWLEDAEQLKVGQNLKYDFHILKNYDITLRGIAHDTMLQSYVLNSTATRHDMDSLASKYLGYQTVHFEDIAGKGAKQLTFNQIELEQAAHYAAEDADVTLRLHEALSPQLDQLEKQRGVYRGIECPLVPVLAEMERFGAKLDVSLLKTQSQSLGERILEIEEEAYELAGSKFNLGSPKQLQEIFFERLGLPIIKKTPKGQPSTAEPVLQELAHDYPLPKLILEHRSFAKLKSTYTDKLPELVDPHTGRIHTSYHQAVAATGRLSSSDPNLQNIPIRTEEGRKIRQAFIAGSGRKLLAADYSQIELRIMAHLSSDRGLLDAFEKGLDVHRATAAEVFGVDIEEVSGEQRRRAKAINFGLIYGMSAFGLGRQINVARKEAQEYIDTYFARYPGVLDYMENTRKQAHDDGFVETLFGRRLHLPDINARNKMLQQAAERTAINAPMQGTAADIIKRAMLSLDTQLKTSGLDAKMMMQVHDELVFDVAEKDLEALKLLVEKEMQAAADLDVPLLVESGSGDNWDEAH